MRGKKSSIIISYYGVNVFEARLCLPSKAATKIWMVQDAESTLISEIFGLLIVVFFSPNAQDPFAQMCNLAEYSAIFCNIVQHCASGNTAWYRGILHAMLTQGCHISQNRRILQWKNGRVHTTPPLIESVILQPLSNTASLSNWHFTKKTKPRQTIDIQLHLLSNPKDLERILKSIDIYWFSNRQAKSRQVLPILHIVLGSKHFHCLLNHIQSLHFLDGTNPLYDIFYLNLCYASWIVLKIKNIVFKWSINMVS